MRDWFLIISRFFNRELIGQDEFGNRYFQEKRPPLKKDKARYYDDIDGSDVDSSGIISNQHKNKLKRWVVYNGFAEASKVPAHWHGWLHHRVEKPVEVPNYPWLKPHLPNMTGTFNTSDKIDHPQEEATEEINRKTHYQPWQPN